MPQQESADPLRDIGAQLRGHGLLFVIGGAWLGGVIGLMRHPTAAFVGGLVAVGAFGVAKLLPFGQSKWLTWGLYAVAVAVGLIGPDIVGRHFEWAGPYIPTAALGYGAVLLSAGIVIWTRFKLADLG